VLSDYFYENILKIKTLAPAWKNVIREANTGAHIEDQTWSLERIGREIWRTVKLATGADSEAIKRKQRKKNTKNEFILWSEPKILKLNFN
jgi:hypothetical protein